MSAETLRRAASLMRERADMALAIQAGAWTVHETGYTVMDGAGLDVGTVATASEAEHIASWHPAVALVVADWLEAEATSLDAMERFQAATVKQEAGWTARGAGISVREHDDGTLSISTDTSAAALAVARAYLGESS